MAENISSKLKGLLKPHKEDNRVQPKKRGVAVDKEELEKWVSTSKFTDLPPRGQEAFFKCLRDNYYQEDEDITDIKAEGLTAIAKRYQFWLKSHKMALGNLVDLYICDDETNIEDVNKFFGKFKDREDIKDKSQSDFLEEKLSCAQKLDKFLYELRDIMKPALDEAFAQRFKTYLKNEYGEKGEKIK